MPAIAERSNDYDGPLADDLPVCTWDQVDNVVFEIGTIANQMKAIRAKRDKQILQAQNEASVTIDRLIQRTQTLQNMVERFVQETMPPDTVISKQLSCGKVRVIGDDVAIAPDLKCIANRKTDRDYE